MTDPDTISADYTLRPSELAATLALLVEARQPVTFSGAPPGSAKSRSPSRSPPMPAASMSMSARSCSTPWICAASPGATEADRTRWAPPAFLPPTDDPGRWLINLEELPSAVPMVQAALYQLVLDRKVGEYELPEGASLIACGNRESDRGVTHRMPTPLASRFVHLEIRVDAADWCAWAAAEGLAPEVIFFVQLRPELLHQFDPAVARGRLRLPPDLGLHFQHRAAPQRPRPGRRARALPGHRRRGGGHRVRGLPEGLARAAPSPHRHRRSRERRSCPTTPAR